MKIYKYPALLAIIFFSFVSTGYADVFGTDDKKWERVFSDLKKISVRLTDNVDIQLKSLQTSQAEVLRMIDALKNTLPTLQGAIEQNDAKMTQQLSKLEGRLAELEGRTKIQLDEQKKSQTEAMNSLKQALAVDIENLAKQNAVSLQTLAKNSSDALSASNAGFANINSNNNKMIDILSKTLQENQETGKTVGSVSKKMGEVNDHINSTRDLVAKLKEIFTAKEGAIQAQNDKLLETLKNVQTQNTALSTSLTTSLQQVDDKVNQAMLKSDPINANLDLANQKLSKLIEILKAFASEQEKIVSNQQAISDSLKEMRNNKTEPSAEPKKSSKTQKKSSQSNEGKSKKSASDD